MKLRVPDFKFQFFLRARFATGFGATLLALMGASALFLLHYTTTSLDVVVKEAIKVTHPVIKINDSLGHAIDSVMYQAKTDGKSVMSDLERRFINLGCKK